MRKNRQNQQSRRKGFTLLEVMVVLLILVTTAGLAVVAVQGRLEISRKRQAFTYVKMLANAVEAYYFDMNEYPTADVGGLDALVNCPSGFEGKWGGPYLQDTATNKDPWGNEYRYECPGTRQNKPFEIWSYGPDKQDGTDDDIGSWRSSLD
jgi:general secretion pathway protein G